MSGFNEHAEGQSRRGGCSGSAGRDAVCPPDPTTTLRAQTEQNINIAAFRGMDRDTPGRDLVSHLAAPSDSHRIPSQFQAGPERHDRGWTNATIGAQRSGLLEELTVASEHHSGQQTDVCTSRTSSDAARNRSYVDDQNKTGYTIHRGDERSMV